MKRLFTLGSLSVSVTVASVIAAQEPEWNPALPDPNTAAGKAALAFSLETCEQQISDGTLGFPGRSV